MYALLAHRPGGEADGIEAVSIAESEFEEQIFGAQHFCRALGNPDLSCKFRTMSFLSWVSHELSKNAVLSNASLFPVSPKSMLTANNLYLCPWDILSPSSVVPAGSIRRLNEHDLQPLRHSNWSPRRRNVLRLGRRNFIKLLHRPRGRVNRKRHPTLTMICLRTVKPQRCIRADFKRDGFEGD